MTPARRIAVLVGSLRAGSINRTLALAVARLAPPDRVFEHLRIDDLPLYNQDLEADLPEPVRRLKREVEAADALLFVTPEYNRSMPGVLKNALDWASRPYGANSFAGKPAGIVGASPGAVGTALAQQHLRNVLAYLDMPTLGQPEAYIQFKLGFASAAGDIADADSRAFVQRWGDTYLAWVERHAARCAPGAAA